jgi:serine/threonine protein kinase/ankyrin repeat protein
MHLSSDNRMIAPEEASNGGTIRGGGSMGVDDFASGCTLLQLCAIGNLQDVKDYVSGVFGNVNFGDYDRRTALHLAASEGHLDVVKYLVSMDAHINRSDRWGGSPLDDAHRHRHTDVARYLRSMGAKSGSFNLAANLIAAAAAGDIEEVTVLCESMGSMCQMALQLAADAKQRNPSLDVSNSTTVSHTRDINEGDYDKRTALHVAAAGGHLEVIEYLCMKGANANVEDRWGRKPLDDALSMGHEQAAELLRKYGATSAKERSQDQFTINAGTKSDASFASHHASVIDDENFLVDFSELEMIESIGSGSFGEIYKCRWRGILVAAKCIKASRIQRDWLLKNRPHYSTLIPGRCLDDINLMEITEEEKEMALEDFRREIEIMRRMRHPNIAMMLGYSHYVDLDVMILELCRCSLHDVLRANNVTNAQIPKRTQIVYAQQLAQGMNYLHKSRPPIIHRDLKPSNLLIDAHGALKIADLYLAKIRPDPEQKVTDASSIMIETWLQGVYRYMAPEVFRHEEYTESVDVYSYSMIFYHMLLGRPPWAGSSELDAITKAAIDGERPLIPRDVDERLCTLLKRCWDENPRARPSFEEIVTCLSLYSHDVFKTNDKEVKHYEQPDQGPHRQIHTNEKKCGCLIS